VIAARRRAATTTVRVQSSQSTVAFYRGLARLRASGRDRPIFDTIGTTHPDTSAEEPWTRHSAAVGEGDYDKLVSVLTDGFGGTRPVPSRLRSGT
jgi:hypothetical protein